jgi:micrococcal nuclease
MYSYQAELIRVVDGDTWDVRIDLGFKMTTEQRVRLAGINTPEIWRQKKDSEEYKKGMAASNYVKQRLAEHKNVFVIETTKEAGVYGRYLATIFLPDNERSLNQELIDEGYAEIYKK